MDRTMCPGQDTRYWRPDDIFNVPCAACGAFIEFFKDDAARRCPKCGTRVRNPRLSMGCAQWCKHAKECLGYDPAEAGRGEAAPAPSVADSIIDALKNEFGGADGILDRSLAAYEKARELMPGDTADPSVIIPAVLLLLADSPGESGRPSRAERIMKDAGVERGPAEDARAIIQAHHSGAAIDSPEFRIVAASHAGQPITPATFT